jgi:hypothetical protein
MAATAKWHPPATGVKDGGDAGGKPGSAAYQWGGTGATTIAPRRVRWEGKDWTVAWSQSTRTLWVMTPLESDIAPHLATLERLAIAHAQHKVIEETPRHALPSVPGVAAHPSIADVQRAGDEGAERAYRANRARECLRHISRLAAEAVECGATVAEVGAAVRSALGLDD